MLTRFNYTFSLLVVVTLCNFAGSDGVGQSLNSTQQVQPSSVTVTAASSGETVRFSAPGNITQIRLEVFSSAGEKIFDSGPREGNVLDWHWGDEKALALGADNYLSVVTVRSLSGKTSRKLANVSFANQQAIIKAIDVTQLNPVQTQAIGTTETYTPLTIIDGEQGIAATVIAHDGNDGQIARTRGAFSFRFGDFFRGRDQEQMRLTEDGNLGIGIAQPKFKLDVLGAIRAREGFVFNDGSILNVNDKGVLTRTTAAGSVTPNALSGTQDRIAKWTDNAGTLGDSSLTDTGSKVGLGVTNPGDLLDIAGAPNGFGRSGIHVRTTTPTGNATLYFDNDRGGFAAYGGVLTGGSANSSSFFGVTRADKTFLIADGPSSRGLGIGTLTAQPVIFGTSNTERMRIATDGSVGIGTPGPATKLDVNGNAFVRGSGTLLNNFGAAELHIGYGIAAPYSAGSVSRLAIQPYGHTGGPWKFVVRDSAIGAYLDLVYGNTTGITQDHQGNVGIGTGIPAQKLTVTGIVQSTSGGFKFPDGSVQTSATVGSTYTTAPYDPGVNAVILSGAPASIAHLNLSTGTYMVTVSLLAANFTAPAGNRTILCQFTNDLTYRVDIAGVAHSTLTFHSVLNVSSGSIDVTCAVQQGDGIFVYERRLTATKLSAVVVQ